MLEIPSAKEVRLAVRGQAQEFADALLSRVSRALSAAATTPGPMISGYVDVLLEGQPALWLTEAGLGWLSSDTGGASQYGREHLIDQGWATPAFQIVVERLIRLGYRLALIATPFHDQRTQVPSLKIAW